MNALVSLVTAIFLVESSGNPNPKPGDGGRAIGPFQIHLNVVKDVNRYYGTRYVHSDMNDIHKASWVCVAYLKMWGTRKHIGREPTIQDLARIWNGGPDGWKEPETLPYWSKIQIRLAFVERTYGKQPQGVSLRENFSKAVVSLVDTKRQAPAR